MNIVLFTHPPFLNSQSMPRFASMLAEGMIRRGHEVHVWRPTPRFYRAAVWRSMQKWMGYVDQYGIFPLEVLSRKKRLLLDNCLFVFADQALGPWVPLVSHQRHVIHCHDFLAQLSAIGEIQENPTSWTGCYYQAFIRQGYSKGKNFISVSKKTKNDLSQFLSSTPLRSEVVYNGLNQTFTNHDSTEARLRLSSKAGIDLASGYILHVGGNQWYKNRVGVIEIYEAWRSSSRLVLPLIMVGAPPSETLLHTYKCSPYKSDIYLLSEIEDCYKQFAYSGASVFLFPSLAEGFGWPIAEAMASGCPVITTNEAPMTEVAGKAAFFIDRRPHDIKKNFSWATAAAKIIDEVLNLSPAARKVVIEAGLKNAKRFDPDLALDRIEEVYQSIYELPENI